MKKKFFSILLIAVMVLSSFSAVFAGSIEVTPADGDEGSHTYTAYQIVTGDVSKDDNGYTYANAVWGSAANPDADGKVKVGGKDYTIDEFLKDFKEGQLSAGDAAAFEAAFKANGKDSTSNVISDLADGYYLVKDTGTIGEGSAATKYILINVLGDEKREIKSKSSVPKVEKKVQDINDSDANPSLSGLQDSADYDIGDTIPYTVTATIGSGIANFEKYSFQFVDTMSKGLTLDESSWDIKVGDTSIKDQFALTSSVNNETGATTWTWAATDIRQSIEDGSKVVLTYNCVLNSDAVVGSAGNKNDVIVKYDNDPNNCGKGEPKGDTPKDTNIVFTYKTIFNKTDEDKNALTGADFKLEKKVNGEYVDVTTLGSGDNKPTKTGSTAGSTFEFSGLDDGEYRLTETTTPVGYNTIDPIEFKITAEHEIESDNPQLTALAGTDGAEFNMTANVSAGSLTEDIVNAKGVVMPETGGMGTTLIYILGAALVIGAGVVLVTRKKADR